MLVAAWAGRTNAEDRAETRKPRRIMPALYMICRPALAGQELSVPRIPPRRGRRGVFILIAVAKQPAQQTAAMMALGRLLLLLRRQVGRVAQAFVVAAVQACPGRDQFLIFRRRLDRFVQRPVRLALFGGEHGVAPDIGGQGA